MRRPVFADRPAFQNALKNFTDSSLLSSAAILLRICSVRSSYSSALPVPARAALFHTLSFLPSHAEGIPHILRSLLPLLSVFPAVFRIQLLRC